jgi:MFS family permease
MIYGAGSALGAALGGYLADRLGWRWEFGIQIPFIMINLLLILSATPSNLGISDGVAQLGLWDSLKTFDIAGSFLITTSVTFFILGLNLGGNVLPWAHPFVISSLVIFAVTAVLLIRVEVRATRPIMPLHLLTSQPRANLIFSNFLGAVIVNTVIFNAPLYFQGSSLSPFSF